MTFEVTKATRTARVDGIEVTEGERIGLVDGTIRAVGSTAGEVLEQLVREHAADHELATLFHSASIGGEAARELAGRLNEAAPDLELELHSGAPEAYAFVMVVE